MRTVGFRDIKFHKPGDSDEQHLRGLEKHGELIGSEEINQFVTFVVEGKTPNPKRDEAQRTASGFVKPTARREDRATRVRPAVTETTAWQAEGRERDRNPRE